MIKGNFNEKAAKAAQSFIAQAKAEEVAKRAEEFIKPTDLEFGSFFYAQAQWLKKKGYDSLFDADIKWALVLKRLAIAQPAAEVAAEAIAKFLGGSVSKGKEEFSAPVITFMGGELRLFDAIQAIEPKEDDAEEVLAIKKELKELWNDWMDLTVPSFKRVLQYNLFPEIKDLKKLSLKALCMSTGQVNALIDRNRGEFLRSYAAPVDRGDYKLAALAAKEQSRDHEKVEEALAKMSEDELERHLIAEAIDTAFKVTSKGQEYKSLAFLNGVPVAPTESDLVKGARAVLEEAGWEWNDKGILTKAGWSWDYILGFYAHLIGKKIDELTAAKYCGLIDILIVNGFDADKIEAIAIEAVQGVHNNPNKIVKLTPVAKHKIAVKAAGKMVTATSILHALYLVAADMAEKFNSKEGTEVLNKAVENIAYAKALTKHTSDTFKCREKDLIKNFIKSTFTADAIACLPDGDLSWVTMPVYSAGPDKYLNYVDTHLGVDITGTGENLYGKVLAEVRDEIRAARTTSVKPSEEATIAATKLKFGNLTIDDIKNVQFWYYQ